MHNKHWMWLGWGFAALLTFGGWVTSKDTVSQTAAIKPPAWTGPEAEPAPTWPQLVLPVLLLGAVAVGHNWWRVRRHRRQLHDLQADMQDGTEAQHQLLTLAGLLPVGISHVEEDAEGHLLPRFVNPRMAELLGVGLDDLQFDAKVGWRHVHPDDLRQANMALAQASESVRCGAPLMEVETLCRVQRDGRTRWLRTRSQLRLAAGDAGRQGVVHIHACTEDITATRSHQKLSQDVLDGCPAPVRIRDLAGRHLLTNPAFDRLHLLRPGESLGKTDAELLPLDVQRLYRAVDERQAVTGETQVFEQALTDACGSHTHQVTQFVLRDEDQRPVATCAIGIDVSAHQVTQGRLYRALDAAPLPVLITSAGRVVFANRRCTELLGVRNGTGATELYADATEQRLLETRLTEEGHVVAHRLRLRGPQASSQEWRVTAVPIDHNGQPAIIAWLEMPPVGAPALRPAHQRAVSKST